jgi:hypothetical protein
VVILPLLLFALFVAALVDVILRRDDQVRFLPKLAWVFIVILLPLIGAVLWFAVGREYEPRTTSRRTLRMPPVPAPSPPPAPTSGTEAELAALEREIEQAERDERIRRLEEELRRRGSGETA